MDAGAPASQRRVERPVANSADPVASRGSSARRLTSYRITTLQQPVAIDRALALDDYARPRTGDDRRVSSLAAPDDGAAEARDHLEVSGIAAVAGHHDEPGHVASQARGVQRRTVNMKLLSGGDIGRRRCGAPRREAPARRAPRHGARQPRPTARNGRAHLSSVSFEAPHLAVLSCRCRSPFSQDHIGSPKVNECSRKSEARSACSEWPARPARKSARQCANDGPRLSASAVEALTEDCASCRELRWAEGWPISGVNHNHGDPDGPPPQPFRQRPAGGTAPQKSALARKLPWNDKAGRFSRSKAHPRRLMPLRRSTRRSGCCNRHRGARRSSRRCISSDRGPSGSC